MQKIVSNTTLDFLSSNRIFTSLKLGDLVYFHEGSLIEPYCAFYCGNTLCPVGSFSYSNSILSADFSIGRYCSIAWGLQFQGPRHPYEFVTTSDITHGVPPTIRSFLEDFEKKEIISPIFSNLSRKSFPKIGNDVWIGSNVTLNDGVTVGQGAVIASNSVVTKSVGEYEIVGGNPAKIIKKRFNDDLISELLKTQWWDYSFSDFMDLPMNKPEDFCLEFMKIKKDLLPFTPKKISCIDIP